MRTRLNHWFQAIGYCFQARDDLERQRMLSIALLAGVLVAALGALTTHLLSRPPSPPLVTDIRVLESRPYARDTIVADLSWVEGTASEYELTLWKKSEDFEVRVRLELAVSLQDLQPQGTINSMIFLPRSSEYSIGPGGLIFPISQSQGAATPANKQE